MTFTSGSMDNATAYQPVIGGVEHLTWHKRRPPAGTIVRLLCGELYQVTETAKPRKASGCLGCDAEFRRHFGLPPRRDIPVPAPRPAEHPQLPVGTGDPDPVPAGPHLRIVS
ncbi:hypothetical protein [Amycolatopsis sp. NPDC052450]|uniref:hypothetical protein n=1 Tax=Amycolatopsis sp. NPDC052450 TaxID=3363937 RepID=UPI0037CC44F6